MPSGPCGNRPRRSRRRTMNTIRECFSLARGPIRTASILLLVASVHAQQPQMPEKAMQHEHQEPNQVHGVEFPRLGRAQMKAGTANLFTLQRALETAQQGNPTLRQAQAGIRAAEARARQAGLYPNPTIGYSGDEIRGGETGGGKQGFFVEQTIVTGGKLARSREVFGKDRSLAEIEAEEQKIRVETAVKMAFYRVLAAQELADVRGQLARIASENAITAKRLGNTGQADETEILEAELEAERLDLARRMQENTLREEWRSLSAAMGDPEMERVTVKGDLEHGWPELSD